MLREKDIKTLLKVQELVKAPRKHDDTKCLWCEQEMVGAPSRLPLGGEARFFEPTDVHEECYADMVEDWKRAGQWRAFQGATKVHMAPRRGIHLVLARVWNNDQATQAPAKAG